MSRCRITVLRRTLNADLAREYCTMIACCTDGIRPVVFRLERIEG